MKPVDAVVHHYGWVKHPAAMQGKVASFNRYWHADDDPWMKEHVPDAAEYAYEGREPLARFEGDASGGDAPPRRRDELEVRREPERGAAPHEGPAEARVEKATGWRPGEYKNFVVV